MVERVVNQGGRGFGVVVVLVDVSANKMVNLVKP